MPDETKFLSEIERGASEIISIDELKERLKKKKRLTVKLGIDPTTSELHLGHSVIFRKLKVFQKYGHKIVLIIGDFTARIGDPSGQDKTRPVLSKSDVMKNVENCKEQIFKLMGNENIEIRYNSEWFENIDINKFLKLASLYTVARMLERDDFSSRYKKGDPITILEFLYPLLQAYDSVVIESDIEIGGNDQKFNLLVGRELQRNFGQEPQIILTVPLLIGTDGKRKMSKTYNNYIGINENPNEFYGKIMSIPDEIMYDWLLLLTDINLNEIKYKHKKEAKKLLAYEVVSQYYPPAIVREVEKEFEEVFSKKGIPSDTKKFYTELSSWKISDLLFATGLISSKNEAKRLIKQGAVELNNERIKENKLINLNDGDLIKIGKRKFVRIFLKERG